MEKKFRKVLIAPLDWGLGHATRCIPLINYFLEKGSEVLIATGGKALTLLKEEFPDLGFYELPQYDIHYQYDSMVLNMLSQLPKIRKVVLQENKSLRDILQKESIDLIVSDNRYGIYHKEVPSVFLGHQLSIQLPPSLQMFSSMSANWHRLQLSSFDQIWVPDFKANPNLSGKLSHGFKTKVPIHFIGPLSRFRFNPEIKQDLPLLIILSGQEPRRSIFEKKIIEELEDWKEETVLVRGLPGETGDLESPYPFLKIYNHLPTDRLETLIARAKRIVSRSGYTSVMDFAAMRKRVLFVPTKGQTEQEYIATYLSENGHALFVTEDKPELKWNLERLDLMFPLTMQNNRLDELLGEALNELKSKK